jgi:hypothetical protein
VDHENVTVVPVRVEPGSGDCMTAGVDAQAGAEAMITINIDEMRRELRKEFFGSIVTCVT